MNDYDNDYDGSGRPVPMQPVQGQPQAGYGGPPQSGYGHDNPAYSGQQPQGQPPGAPVQEQPVQGKGPQVPWAAPPEETAPVGCPPGLEYLTQVDQLVIKQQIELLELVTGWETENKYRVLNSVGQQVYFAKEESSMFQRQCCGPSRGFVIHLTDNSGREVIRLTREFKCCACGANCCLCCDACQYDVTVEAPVGTKVGSIKNIMSPWKPRFTMYTADGEELGHINGPCCICNCPCCGDIEFPVMSKDGTQQVGNVAKQWSGLLREFMTDADTFSITFPKDMDVKMKAVMMGSLFLIDFMYFENNQNNNH